MSVNLFASQGLFSSLIGTYVNQQIEREVSSPIYEGSNRFNAGKDGFFLVDAILGFRLPNRRGVLSLEGRNILDSEFLYRNFFLSTMNELSANPYPIASNRFITERTIFLRLTLNF